MTRVVMAETKQIHPAQVHYSMISKKITRKNIENRRAATSTARRKIYLTYRITHSNPICPLPKRHMACRRNRYLHLLNCLSWITKSQQTRIRINNRSKNSEACRSIQGPHCLIHKAWNSVFVHTKSTLLTKTRPGLIKRTRGIDNY